MQAGGSDSPTEALLSNRFQAKRSQGGLMLNIIRLVFILGLLTPHAALAQQQGLKAFGVVLMHGKGGQPGGPIGSLATALESEGVKVVMPVMAWSGSRGQPSSYNTPYSQALDAIDAAVANLRARGATKIVIAGQSLGANAAIAYAARNPSGLAGIAALVPGHTPDRMRRPEMLAAVMRACALVAQGQGKATDLWPDLNQDRIFTVNGTAAAYLSFVDQDGLAAMPKNAARLGDDG
jgi:pimeloyl-ACP methyl ester carboxylesterase